MSKSYRKENVKKVHKENYQQFMLAQDGSAHSTTSGRRQKNKKNSWQAEEDFDNNE